MTVLTKNICKGMYIRMDSSKMISLNRINISQTNIEFEYRSCEDSVLYYYIDIMSLNFNPIEEKKTMIINKK